MPKRFWATWPTTMFVLSPFVATTTRVGLLDAGLAEDARRPCRGRRRTRRASARRAAPAPPRSRRSRSRPSRRWSSFFATDEPTRPQPTTIAFMSERQISSAGSDSPPRGRPADRRSPSPRRAPSQHVVDRRAEEARLPPPARRRAQHDQVGVAARAPASTIASPIARARTISASTSTPCSAASSLRLGERGLRLLLGVDSSASSGWSSGTRIT